MSPAPRELHERVVVRLIRDVGNYLEREPVGAPYGSKSDISWGPDILVQPDLLVADLAQARTGRWSSMQRLLLAVEVLSPGWVRADKFTKRVLYQRNHVETYWVVDCDERHVEVWTPGAIFPVTVDDALRWKPAGAATELVLSLEELFKPV